MMRGTVADRHRAITREDGSVFGAILVRKPQKIAVVRWTKKNLKDVQAFCKAFGWYADVVNQWEYRDGVEQAVNSRLIISEHHIDSWWSDGEIVYDGDYIVASYDENGVSLSTMDAETINRYFVPDPSAIDNWL